MKNVSFFLFATLGSVDRVFKPNNLLMFIALSFFALQSVAYSQESGFVTFKGEGYSVSYPQTWVRDSDVPTQFTTLYVFKDVDDADYIGFDVQKGPGIAKTTDEFLNLMIKNVELYTKDLIDPIVIKNERIKWAAHDAVLSQYEFTGNAGSRLTALRYTTVVDGTIYRISFSCRKVYFPEFKPIMEKVAASFSFSSIKTKTDKPIEEKAVTERKPKSKLQKRGKN